MSGRPGGAGQVLDIRGRGGVCAVLPAAHSGSASQRRPARLRKLGDGVV